jgi:hypothetical protein
MTVSVNGTTGITFNDASSQNTAATGFGFKNRIINGAMVISQRNGTSTVSAPTDGQFVLDRFNNFTSGGGVYSVGQSTTAPAGFGNSMLYTVTTADASIASTDYYLFVQPIEGYNCSDLAYGTASAKTVTVSFWVRSSVTGTFGFGLRQRSGTRSYVGQYTISAANTWEQKSITIAGDTAGTIANDNDTGLLVTWDLGSGSNRNGTANTWQAGNYWRAVGNTNLISTSGATLYITGVQLEVGSTATSFDYRPYGTELALCQRYFLAYGGEFASQALASGGFISTTGFLGYCAFPTTMRAASTISFTGSLDVRSSSSFNVTAVAGSGGATSAAINATVSGATTNDAGVLRCNDVNNGKILFSAEL